MIFLLILGIVVKIPIKSEGPSLLTRSRMIQRNIDFDQSLLKYNPRRYFGLFEAP